MDEAAEARAAQDRLEAEARAEQDRLEAEARAAETEALLKRLSGN